MKKQTLFNVFQCINSYTPSVVNTEKRIFRSGEAKEYKPPETITGISESGEIETEAQFLLPEDAEEAKRQAEAASEYAASRLAKMKEIEKAGRDERIKAWFDLEERLAIRLILSPLKAAKVKSVYDELQGSALFDNSDRRWEAAKHKSAFNTEEGFKKAAQKLMKSVEAAGFHDVDWSAICGDNQILKAAFLSTPPRDSTVATAPDTPAATPEIREISVSGDIRFADAPGRTTAAEALSSTPPPEPPPAESVPTTPTGVAPAAPAAPATESPAAETPAAEPATLASEPAAAPSAPAAAPERAEKKERKELSDDDKVSLTYRLLLTFGSNGDKLKQALGDMNLTDTTFVKAVEKAQGEIYDVLPAAEKSKFKTREEFVDGIWGPETQRALETVATQQNADQKWKTMLAALKPPAAAERVAAAPTEAAPEAQPVSVPQITKYPAITKPTEIHYPLGRHRAPEEVSPKQAEAGDILKIAYGRDVIGYGRKPVNLPAGTLLKVLRIAERKSGATDADATYLKVQTADARKFILPVNFFDTVSQDEATLFGQQEYAAAIRQYDANFEADTRDATGLPAGFQHDDMRFAVLKQQTNIAGQGKRTRKDVPLGAVSQNDVIAILKATDNQYLVRAQDGRVGFIYKNAVNPAAIVERGSNETIELAVERARKRHETLVAAAAPAPPRAPAQETATASPALQPAMSARQPLVAAEGAGEEPPA